MTLHWTRDHVYDLLMAPHKLLVEGSRKRWVLDQGGFEAIHDQLRELPLSAQLRALLEAFLAEPGEAVSHYCARLHLHRSSYHRHQNALLDQIAGFLTMQPAPAPAPEPPRPAGWNLPLPPEPAALYGRAAELADLTALLSESQLVTMIGPGGVGKTRLALRLAHERRRAGGRVHVASLASISEPAQLLPAIAAGLGLPATDAGEPASRALAAALGDEPALLVLDNLEQTLAAAGVLARLLELAPKLRMLVTSRLPTRLARERTYAVPPLAVAGDGDADAAQSPAAQLFAARARQVDPAFALTADNRASILEICRRLGGLPLAIELAAARGFGQSPALLLAHMDRRLALLTDGPADLPARQQTLRATLGWSFGLLPASAQQLAGAVSALSGAWSLEAAQALAAADQVTVVADLATLLSHSFISAAPQAVPGAPDLAAFQMPEEITAYAGERLAASGDEPAVRQRLAAYYAGLAERLGAALAAGDQAAGARLQWEYPNLSLALERSLRDAESRAFGARIGAALGPFWRASGMRAEGIARLEELLEAGELEPPARARALEALGALLQADQRADEAARAYAESLRLCQQTGDLAGVMRLYALIADIQARPDERRAYLEQSLRLARELHDRPAQLRGLRALGDTAWRAGDLEGAGDYYADMLPIARQSGDQAGVALAYHSLGWAAFLLGDSDRGQEFLEKGLALRRRLGSQDETAATLARLAALYRSLAEPDLARDYCREALALQASRSPSPLLASLFDETAAWLAAAAQPARAARLIGASDRIAEEIGTGAEREAIERRSQLERELREAMGRSQWSIARAHGYAQPTGEALRDALGWLRDPADQREDPSQ